MQMQRISIAPMLDITNTYFRYLMRLLSRKATLYTQMIHANAVLHSPFRQNILEFHSSQHPIVLQLGGNSPQDLALCSVIARQKGYDQINLNVGCPSPKVQSGCFGACLMNEPKRVAECMAAMHKASGLPCTVKCRIGVDQMDSYQFFREFIGIVSSYGGVKHFIVHARKAFLKGLNPAQNRTIPPLKYDYVYNIKKDFPDLKFTINGGFRTYKQIQASLDLDLGLQGVMLGRVSYEQPWTIGDVDRQFFGVPNNGFSREEVIRLYAQYIQEEMARNQRLNTTTVRKPIINLFHGEKNCKVYRTALSISDKQAREFGSFSQYMEWVIEETRGSNEEALSRRHSWQI